MDEDHQAQAPVPAPLPPPPNGDFMTELQWDVFYALLDGAMPGITSQSAQSTKAHPDHDRIALSDEEFERLLEQATQALPVPVATDEPAPTRDDLRTFLEYRPVADALVRQDCLVVLGRSTQRAKLAQVLDLMT